MKGAILYETIASGDVSQKQQHLSRGAELAAEGEDRPLILLHKTAPCDVIKGTVFPERD